MSNEREPLLDPIDRVCEIVFGVLMALSFTGALSVATAGRQEVRTMMFTALGCNLAWGLVDAVMYLIRTATERRRKSTLLAQLRTTGDKPEAHRLITDALPQLFAAIVQPATLDALHQGLLTVREPTVRLGGRDYAAAFGVFALVVLATFPVVIPFIFISKIVVALRVSNILALVTLFIGGFALGRYTGGRPWLTGVAMSGIGAALLAIIIALGG
ncbi:VIT1/CCC1 transporter family protein [Paraburkholderia sp. BL10I2N1]|uniref:VIT1/CCC1 transporter family protein n=1 Tax=Paraburkholderia sp. BL10I2N1 TaxID=1938796 RepID=UPI00105ED9DF|nr:VIT1/CCC1 transporter family protein [Paraburkholderia sp. BL10I2N1]TDN70143.1 VIT family protein [Paraburkholderia sp. BL10I2N1]